jgi:hypothetical protein
MPAKSLTVLLNFIFSVSVKLRLLRINDKKPTLAESVSIKIKNKKPVLFFVRFGNNVLNCLF